MRDATHLHGEAGTFLVPAALHSGELLLQVCFLGAASTSVIVLRRDWSSQERRTRMKATRSKKPSPRFQLSRQPLKQRQHSRSSRSERGRIPDTSTCSGRAAIAAHRSWTSPCSLRPRDGLRYLACQGPPAEYVVGPETVPARVKSAFILQKRKFNPALC